MEQVTTLAVDLAKEVFFAVGEDATGRVCFEREFRSRRAFERFLEGLSGPLEVVLETGSGAHYWARRLHAQGVEARLLPAQRVCEHRSGHKNDRKDARALLRARRDEAIHPVPVKSAAALELQAVHRVRSGWLQRRTAVANQLRGLLAEHGVVIARGEAALRRRLEALLGSPPEWLNGDFHALLAELEAEYRALGDRLARADARLKRLAAEDPQSRRLATLRGVGPIGATALACKAQQAKRFANARQFAAYFGVVPRQHSTGGKTRLGRMSRQGDGYVRRVLVSGAQAVLQKLPAEPGEAADTRRLQRWRARHGTKGAAVRLANRNLRIAWVLLTRGGSYEPEPRRALPGG
ncbi:IS110 family transposase [wastewater metagenome]|uniref:IS110 family transposase ISPpu11 n=3 Tax=root TaxID=1 RepID=A0A5B8RHE0_9ZZZZ|nr:IS110 family transposase ISPpu11 [uncultured organism]